MSERRPTSAQVGIGGLGYRTIAGLVVAVLMVVVVALHSDETEISFIAFSAQTALWIALAVAAAGVFVAGFLIGRHRYRG